MIGQETSTLIYSNLPNRALLIGNFENLTGGSWTLPEFTEINDVYRSNSSARTIALNVARITTTDANPVQDITTLSIWIDPDYTPIQTDQPTSGYNLPQSNVSFNIISVLSTNSNFQIQGTLNFIIPSSLAGIASGNLDEVFSHTQATPYIEVGSGKTVPASDQWGAYRLTLRFGSGVERTVYVKIRD